MAQDYGGGILFDPSAPRDVYEQYRQMQAKLVPLSAEEKEIEEQLALAEELRTTKDPAMRANSRIMVAANPLEHIGAGIKRYQGETGRKAGQEKRKALGTKIRDIIMGTNVQRPWVPDTHWEL